MRYSDGCYDAFLARAAHGGGLFFVGRLRVCGYLGVAAVHGASRKPAASHANAQPLVVQLSMHDEIEPLLAEYLDNGLQQAAASARQPRADLDGHSRRAERFDAGHHPAHSAFARSGCDLRGAFRRSRGFGGFLYFAVCGRGGHGAGHAHRARPRR